LLFVSSIVIHGFCPLHDVRIWIPTISMMWTSRAVNMIVSSMRLRNSG